MGLSQCFNSTAERAENIRPKTFLLLSKHVKNKDTFIVENLKFIAGIETHRDICWRKDV